MLLKVLLHDSPSPLLDRAPVLTFHNQSPWGHSRKVTLCKSLGSEMSDSKGTLKALSQPWKSLPWIVGLDPQQGLPLAQASWWEEGVGWGQLQDPSSGSFPRELHLETPGEVWSHFWVKQERRSQTRLSNSTSTHMRFEGGGGFWALWFQALMLELFIGEENNY